MALYWPEQRVALDIIDDPLAEHVPDGEGWTVVRVTCADLADFESYDRAMKHLLVLLGQATPEAMAELNLYEEKRRQVHDDLFNLDFLR